MDSISEDLEVRLDNADIRLMALLTKLNHWAILIEREQKAPPKFEVWSSIRRKCVELEAGIAPELEHSDILSPLGSDRSRLPPVYVEAKWLLILLKTDDVRVKRLIALMKKANVPKDTFCKTLGEFSSEPIENINLVARPLSVFSSEEVKSSLKYLFREETQGKLKIAIKAITHVLMKV